MGDVLLCESCTKKIRPFRPSCVRCGTTILRGITCADCRGETPLAGVVTIGSYADPVLRTAIHALKFRGVRGCAEPLGGLLARSLGPVATSFSMPPTLVPLPLHPRRERGRGFNQAALIAEHAGKRLAVPVQSLLRRVRSGAPQTSVAASAAKRRQTNIAGSFTLAPTVTSVPETCILIDDVLTTGATLEEAARVLYAHGAKDIWGAVICRG